MIHEGLPEKEFDVSETALERRYCTVTGKLAGPRCYSTDVGWYDAEHLPETCYYCTGGGTRKTTTKASGENYTVINPRELASSIINNYTP